MTKKEIYEILNKEIEWCEQDKNRTMPEDWHKGFIDGLKQAKTLIKKVKCRRAVHEQKKLLTNNFKM